MKLHVLSDLHTEFSDLEPPETDADIVVLAGDIGTGTGGVEWASRQFTAEPVIYVPGNHEYYDNDIGMTDRLRQAASANVNVLNNDVFVKGGVRFLGATLWTDFKFDGEGDAWFSRQSAKTLVDDFRSIRNGDRLFTPEDSVHLHRASVHWLVTELEREFSGPTVVITHHLPSSLSVAKRYVGDALNPAFASRLEGVIEKYQPILWIHGHTHVPCDYEVFGTRVVCNPRGYPGEKNEPAFRPDLIVSI